MTFSKKKSSYTKISLYFTLIVIAYNFHFSKNIWDKVFKSGLSKFCGRQPLKSFSGYGLLQHYFVPFDLLFFGNAKKSLNTKILYKSFYSDWKETTHKRSAEAVSKKPFSPMRMLFGTAYFDGCLLFHVIIGTYCFS